MLLWIDDINIMGPRAIVMRAKGRVEKGLFEIKGIGEMAEYIGCKIRWDWSSRSMTMMQSVKIQRFEDEYDQEITKVNPVTPLEAGAVY